MEEAPEYKSMLPPVRLSRQPKVQPSLFIFHCGLEPREVFMSTTVTGPKGLEGITAANSGICYIDGDQGVLAYRGIDIRELADNSTFEEVCYLLWFGRLPNRSELQELKLNLARERKLDASIISLLHQAPKHALPMDVLRTIISALAF